MCLRVSSFQLFVLVMQALFDSDPEFKKRAYGETVKLQSGDPDVTLAWKLICDVSRREFQEIYNRLDVTLEEKGESFYQSRMQGVVEELSKKGLVSPTETTAKGAGGWAMRCEVVLRACVCIHVWVSGCFPSHM